VRLALDLDATLCTGYPYDQAVPLPGKKELLHNLREQGHVVAIHTARGMGSSGNSVGKAVALYGLLTLQQLRDWGFEYDEIWFGKPSYDLVVDDKMTDFQRLEALAGDYNGRSEPDPLQN
jgi:hypothetical protein